MSVMMLRGRISPSPLSFSKSKVLRYTSLAVLSAALYVGITSYARSIHTIPDARSIHTIPECALENHHGIGNCPVQILRWYPYLEEDLRNRKASHTPLWPIRPERVKTYSQVKN
jgi:hypothetical protein